MNHRLLDLFREYRQRSSPEAGQTLFEFLAEKDPHIFSHHPPDSCFRNHVWKIKGLYFCKGCLVTLIGMLAGALLAALTGWPGRMAVVEVAGLFILMLAPTLITHVFDLSRPLKHISRFLLGIVMVSALIMLFVTDSWAVRLLIVGTYLAIKVPLARKRARMNRELAEGKGS